MEEVLRELENPDIWNDPKAAQEFAKEKGRLEATLGSIDAVDAGLEDVAVSLEFASEEDDESFAKEAEALLAKLEKTVADLEFRRMFSGKMDDKNCYLDIQAGSGGTEAQDWAEMLLRMYLRFCDSHGFKAELMEVSAGDVAGIKSATCLLYTSPSPRD